MGRCISLLIRTTLPPVKAGSETHGRVVHVLLTILLEAGRLVKRQVCPPRPLTAELLASCGPRLVPAQSTTTADYVAGRRGSNGLRPSLIPDHQSTVTSRDNGARTPADVQPSLTFLFLIAPHRIPLFVHLLLSSGLKVINIPLLQYGSSTVIIIIHNIDLH